MMQDNVMKYHGCFLLRHFAVSYILSTVCLCHPVFGSTKLYLWLIKIISASFKSSVFYLYPQGAVTAGKSFPLWAWTQYSQRYINSNKQQFWTSDRCGASMQNSSPCMPSRRDALYFREICSTNQKNKQNCFRNEKIILRHTFFYGNI